MVNEGPSISDLVVLVIILGKMSPLKTLTSIILGCEINRLLSVWMVENHV